MNEANVPVPTTYSYNGRNQLTDEVVTKTGTDVFTQHYTLAANGRRDAVDGNSKGSGGLCRKPVVTRERRCVSAIAASCRDAASDTSGRAMPSPNSVLASKRPFPP